MKTCILHLYYKHWVCPLTTALLKDEVFDIIEVCQRERLGLIESKPGVQWKQLYNPGPLSHPPWLAL